jgi:Fur family ferric uptake transcriptional regulator
MRQWPLSSCVPAPLGQRHTRQRDAILLAITDAKGPVSIQQILERAQAALGSLGIATVYRTLNLLQEGKRIQTIILPDGQTCYERSGLGHHDHFQCRKCRNVYDLEVCPLHLAAGTIIPGGYLVQDHEMTLYGICPACSGTKPAAKTVLKTAAVKQVHTHSDSCGHTAEVPSVKSSKPPRPRRK